MDHIITFKSVSLGTRRRLAVIAVLLVCLIYTLAAIPPKSSIIVFAFIGAFSILTAYIVSLFVSQKYALLGFLSSFIFLSVNYIVGFQLINTALLISVIIGIVTLMKR